MKFPPLVCACTTERHLGIVLLPKLPRAGRAWEEMGSEELPSGKPLPTPQSMHTEPAWQDELCILPGAQETSF